MRNKGLHLNMTNKVVALLSLGLFSLLSSMSGSSTNLALPSISYDLHISNLQSTWVVQVAMIVASITFVLFGYFGDILSKNFVFIVGGFVFILGSLITGAALGFLMIILGRIFQAIGFSMIMANSLGIVSEEFDDNSRGQALATVSMFTTVGQIAGPAIGGMIISVSSWRWIYLINVPLCCIVMIFSLKSLKFPHYTLPKLMKSLKGFNCIGEIIFAAGISILFLSGLYFQHGVQGIWKGLILVILGSAISIAAFFQDQHAKQALIPIRLVRNVKYLMSIFILLLVMLVNAMTNILLPFYLQSFNGMSPFSSGLIMMGQSLAMLATTPIAGYLADHKDRMKLTIVGLLILLLSQIGYALYPAKVNLVLIMVPVLLNGIGIAVFLSPNLAITMGSVDKKVLGVAGSINSFARTLGATVGISMTSALLFSQLPHVAHIKPNTGMAFMHAFSNTLWIGVLVNVLAVIVVIARKFITPKTAK